MIHDPLPTGRSEAERFTDRLCLLAVGALALLVAVHLVRWAGRGWLW